VALLVAAPASRADVVFPALPVGTNLSSEASASFSNDGADPIMLGTAGLTGADAKAFHLPSLSDGCSGQRLEPGDACQLTLEFTPQHLGDHHAVLTIAVSGGGGGSFTLGLSGQGTPSLAFSPTLVDFGVVSNGAGFGTEPKPRRAITVQNVSDQPLTSLQLRLAPHGGFSITASTCTPTLEAHASCALGVSMTGTGRSRSEGGGRAPSPRGGS
jgi:hypothetical protein